MVSQMTDRTRPNVVDFRQKRRVAASEDLMPKGRRDLGGFYSILFERPEDRVGGDTIQAPDFFTDLNCDQIVSAITVGREEYNLTPFFHAPLKRVEAVEYRHEVLRDLEIPQIHKAVSFFASKMREVRQHLLQSQKMYYQGQKEAWFLDAAELYCDATKAFAADLFSFGVDLRSRGLRTFCDYLRDYIRSAAFSALHAEVQRLKAALATVEYSVLIRGSGFTVRKSEAEADYSASVQETFSKFQQGAAKDYRVKFPASAEMNHVEAKILEFVAKLFPEIFEPLEAFYSNNANFMDGTIAAFDRESQFYLAYLDYAAPLQRAGLSFCYPHISDTAKEVNSSDSFDIALAHKLLKDNLSVVCNDFHLQGRERILVVSGPNQGGKTTFARAFGQLHYLASIGCPVPGKEARLALFDQLFTHFEREEKVENLRGKLEDDLHRIHDILKRATRQSIIVLNEIFTSTTIQDETFLSERTMERITDLGALCVWVTFVDELASFGPQVVSMVSTVVPENPAQRTYKILRRPADGLAFAMAIAQKYGLTYDSIRARIKS